MVTSGAMLKGASVHLYSLAVPTFSLIHHLKEITVPPQGIRQLWLVYGFCKWALQWIISIILMKIDWLLNISELWMQTILHLQLPAPLSGSEMQSLCRGCRLKYCIAASPIRHICSLQNNLLPWQRNFIIQAHCYLLSQQELNVP